MGNIREPVKKSSIEKKNLIIEKGFELMTEKGYHNVNCIDIARYSGVSTGIIYQYFLDKRDIFIAGVKNYSRNIMFPMMNILEKEDLDIRDLKVTLNKLIESFIETHTMSKQAHEELMAMSHLDEEIGRIFKRDELNIANRVVEVLKSRGINRDSLNEKVHIIIGLIDNYCHEVVYHQHESLDYLKMKEEIVNICYGLLS